MYNNDTVITLKRKEYHLDMHTKIIEWKEGSGGGKTDEKRMLKY